MSLQDVISRRFSQVVVYWGNPQSNGYGGFTFDEPVEIYCRLENILQGVRDATVQPGDLNVSRAVMYVEQDVDVGGFVYFGTLEDLDSAEEANPLAIESNVFEIRRFEKIPELGSATRFLRRVDLAPWLTLNT